MIIKWPVEIIDNLLNKDTMCMAIICEYNNINKL